MCPELLTKWKKKITKVNSCQNEYCFVLVKKNSAWKDSTE